VSFAATAVKTTAQGGIFPTVGSAPLSLPLTASFTVQSQPFNAATVIQLLPGADPYFTNINPAANNVFYLSQDLRVFTATPGINPTPISGVGTPPSLTPSDDINPSSAAGYSYIQSLLQYLNINYSNPLGTDPFTLFPDQTSALTADSSVSPSVPDPVSGTLFTNYNFAVARVRLNGTPNTTSGENVRVFFRLFITQSCDTDYQPDSTYLSNNDPAGFPGSPALGTSDTTIPFFATGNFDNTAYFNANDDYGTNTLNNQPIPIGAGGGAWAYYGCFLNLYPVTNAIGGKPILSLLAGNHHCLVAQIAFDDAPILNSNGTTKSPENSDKLAQRNLQITLSDNPGPPATHRVPQTFDLRPSATPGGGSDPLTNYPDELMIEWGDTPPGSTATIYWPAVNASDVLTLAKQLYSTQQLSAADPNTIQCKTTAGITYVPIPTGSGTNFAGLFTIDLPPGVTVGQEFDIVVRRLSSRQPPPVIAVTHLAGAAVATAGAAAVKTTDNWRYVVGSFAVKIPVANGRLILPIEENTLAIMKWRLTQIPTSSRWYPVLQRYISIIAGRVDGLGGNSGSVAPSPTGLPPVKPPTRVEEEVTGKIEALIYDHFGNFAGFIVETERGRHHRFESREPEMRGVVRRAWAERIRVSVLAERDHPHIPREIILRVGGGRLFRRRNKKDSLHAGSRLPNRSRSQGGIVGIRRP
jgi:hypothetical protein